ncbi:YeiH family protein [Curvivirga aplysinae]|uniref:YeiH family protein n=1 Tax=Curvivirga aplysinae TaxID=2529852 RepID=UPI001C3FA901|nr:putative sulfate exporter family transporter [Curvivirga aplysinae]
MSEESKATGFMNSKFEEGKILFPGVIITVIVAIAASFLSEHHGGPVMLYALLLGTAFHFLSKDEKTADGIQFSAKTVLRVGVALLGARITIDQVAELGLWPLLVVVASIGATILFGLITAKLLKQDKWFGVLTGGSVAICGASAAAALSAVLPKSKEAETNTIFAVVGVTTLSTLAMVFYPLIAQWSDMSDVGNGFFLGATIHDVAQVVGAGYSVSETAGDTATVVKLFRVAMLVPVVLVVSIAVSMAAKDIKGGKKAVGVPGFLIGFVILVLLKSFGFLPDQIADFLKEASRWCLITAIAAIGIRTSLGDFRSLGFAPVVMILSETAFLAVIGFVVACIGY